VLNLKQILTGCVGMADFESVADYWQPSGVQTLAQIGGDLLDVQDAS